MNAIADALSAYPAADTLQMPARASDIWRIIQNKRHPNGSRTGGETLVRNNQDDTRWCMRPNCPQLTEAVERSGTSGLF
jgi:hypothetical protein